MQAAVTDELASDIFLKLQWMSYDLFFILFDRFLPGKPGNESLKLFYDFAITF